MTGTSPQLRLWQLISPTLPVGAYAYSTGLEYAVECGWVKNESEATEWICGQLQHNLATLDVPVLSRLYMAWQENDIQQVIYWNRFLLAARESKELRDEDCHLGSALALLLPELGISINPDVMAGPVGYATLFSLGASHWQIPVTDMAQGYLWAWAENQVAAAIKLIPLGQTAGQRIMSSMVDIVPAAVSHAATLEEDDIGAIAPAVAIASAKHETQYSRLFRS